MENSINILDKFTSHFKESLEQAFAYAVKSKKSSIEPIDIFWALLKQKGSLAHEVLAKSNLKLPPNRRNIKKISQSSVDKILARENSSEIFKSVRQIIAASANTASKFNHKYIGSEHLLYGLVSSKDEKILEVLTDNSTDINVIFDHLEDILDSTSRFGEMTQAVSSKTKSKQAQKQEMVLDLFGTCLTSRNIQSNLTPVIGRDGEVNRVIQILSRKNKNNPILLGEPGVGKTAIVEGLAKMIFDGDVPDILINKKIYTLDMNSLVAGTSYRGDFEARIKYIIEEAKQDPDIILFIDEIHNISGAGSASGTMDAANILKPALARGEIRCIGATTYDDYKRYIEPDSALARRFQSVKVAEPTEDEAIHILAGIKHHFETHHGVSIDNSAIKEAVYLSSRYMAGEFLPDKAIDLIDEASARKKITNTSNPNLKKITDLGKELADVFADKHNLISSHKYDQAIGLKQRETFLMREICRLEDENELKQELKSKANQTITDKDIAHIVAEATKINIPNSNSQASKLKNLEKLLIKQIIGQKHAITELVSTLKRSAVGLSGDKRPLGSFIFAGPSGVGKTHTAKVLAEALFPGQNSLIRLDMSEFGEKFNASKILGAPAGYVGYQEGSSLLDKIKQNPYSVILLDEIEKAHPDIFNIFLQILEDGRLQDSKGKIINFKNTIIIMTTNIGLKRRQEKQSVGFGNENKANISQNYNEKLEEFLRPEFLNRIDHILIFNSLTKSNLKRILSIELKHSARKLSKQNIVFNYDKKILDYLLENVNNHQGARQIRKTVEQKIENPLAEHILGKESAPVNIKVGIKDKKINIS